MVCSTASYAQQASVNYPAAGSVYQQVGGVAGIEVAGSAAGTPYNGGMEFAFDLTTPSARSVRLFQLPFIAAFPSMPVGEHTLDASVISSSGARLGTPDHRDRIGVGDISVAVGDSITAGEVDDLASDDYSADGRNGPKDGYGGFEPILNDMLTWARGYPNPVPNEGLSGENTNGARVRIADIISRYPGARTWLIGYGTNDANGGISASAYKANLESIINQIHAAIPGASLYLPRVLYHDETGAGSAYIPSYDATIAELSQTMSGVYRGADLDTLFRANHAQYPDHIHGQAGTMLAKTRTHHPNGIGITKMATLWKMALVDRAFLVTDGYFDTLGDLDTDRVLVEAITGAGVNGANLLEVCDQTGKGAPPPGTWVVGDWRVRLKLTNATNFGGAKVYVTMRLDEPGDLLPAGFSWNNVYLANGNTVLYTYRGTNSGNSRIHYLSAQVDRPELIMPIFATNIAAPVTTMSIVPAVPTGKNGWYTAGPEVSFKSTDAFGRPAKIWVAWDNESEQRYRSSLSIPPGKHTLYYHGVDDSNISETVKSYVIKLDAAAPTVPSVKTSVQTLKPGQSVNVTWKSSDPESGIDKYEYAIGTGPGRTNIRGWTGVGLTQSVSYRATKSPGTKYYFSVRARNRAGLYSAVGTSGAVTVIQ